MCLLKKPAPQSDESVLLAETGPECYILSDEEGFARMKEAEEG